AGRYVVQLAVGVELRVERVGCRAAHVRGEQRDAAGDGRGKRILVLADDHDRRRADRDARVLVWRALDAARDHQAYVDAVGHLVGPQGAVDRRGEGGAVHPDVEHDRPRALVQPVEVLLEEGGVTAADPKPLPDPVTQDVAGVEDRDLRFVAV